MAQKPNERANSQLSQLARDETDACSAEVLGLCDS